MACPKIVKVNEALLNKLGTTRSEQETPTLNQTVGDAISGTVPSVQGGSNRTILLTQCRGILIIRQATETRWI